MRLKKRYIEDQLVEFTIDGVPQPLDGAIPIPKSIEPDNWPIWAKVIRQFANDEDRGIGDVIARTIGDERSEKFKAWHLATFGKSCGCSGRQAGLNRKYPFK